MRRALRLTIFYFSFHPMVIVAVVGGIAMMFASWSLSAWFPQARWPTMLGSYAGVIFMMPTIWSAGVFRQLISNRMLMLVPGFRGAAIVSFALVAVTVSGIFCCLLAIGTANASPRVLATSFTLCFAALSALLLLSQWSCTLRAGFLLQMVFFIGGIGSLVANSGLAVSLFITGIRPVGWAAMALLGWLLLYRVLGRAGTVAGPFPPTAWNAWPD